MRTGDSRQTQLLLEIQELISLYLDRGPETGESPDPQAVLEIQEVLAFHLGHVDGIGSLTGLDRARRRSTTDQYVTAGRKTALAAVEVGDITKLPLWSELHPN